jgi:hypothetical protein
MLAARKEDILEARYQKLSAARDARVQRMAEIRGQFEAKNHCRIAGGRDRAIIPRRYIAAET